MAARIVKRLGYEIKDIKVSSHRPDVIYASLYLDGNVICHADLDYCQKRLKGLIERKIYTWEDSEAPPSTQKVTHGT